MHWLRNGMIVFIFLKKVVGGCRNDLEAQWVSFVEKRATHFLLTKNMSDVREDKSKFQVLNWDSLLF